SFGSTTANNNIGSITKAFNEVYASTYNGRSISINNFDLAEEYHVTDTAIEAGDVVKLQPDSTDKLAVTKAGGDGFTYDRDVMGVISTEPGLYLKDWQDNNPNGRPVALAGRVPIKVTDENGPIKRGDYLTASSTPGYAMKATKSGVIIARAMEDFGVQQTG